MRLKSTIPLFAIALPLAAACGGNSSSSVQPDPAPITRSAFGLSDTKPAPIITPAPVVTVEKPVTVEKVEPALPPPATYAEAMHRAQDLSDKGDHPGAIDALLAAVKLAPKSAAPHVELARLYLADGKIPVARKHALRATKLNPAWSGAWNTLGRVEMADGKLDDARGAFQTAIESNEDNAFAWNNMGLTYIYVEQWQDAADALDHAVAVKDAPAYMWNNLGVAYEHLDRLDEARHAYDQSAAAGSDAGKKSRARLEGVKSIVTASAAPAAPTDEVPGSPDITPDVATPDAIAPASGGTQ